MDNDTLAALLKKVDLEGMSSTDVATEWLMANDDKWKEWASCAM
jgi:glycine betaine/proline transport system substrate-binding protein